MKIKKRLLGILLSLALILGMMPGMSLTAYADTQSFLILRDSAFFNAARYDNNGVWQGSNAQLWCTNYYTSNLKTNFAEYIDGVDKTDAEKTISQGSSSYFCASQEIKGSTGGEDIDKVFFLSAAEYEQYKNINDMILETGYGLRTVGDGGALSINAVGRYSWANVNMANLSARPALYLKSTFFKAYKDDSGIRYWSSNASEPGYTESTNLASELTNHTNKLKLNDDTYWTVLGYKIPTYTVTFDSNDHGTAPASQNVPSGEKVTKPSDPTDPNLAFAGWYKEEACTNEWNFETDTVTAATTLYAKWIEITKYPIYVGDVQVTSANAGNITGAATPTASYDAASNTLTLKGVSINTGYNSAGIYYKNDDTPLNIILEGNNSIIGDGITTGIYGAGYNGSFTFSGDGSLNTSGTSSGISSYYGSVKIDNVTINASGTGSSGISANGAISINGGNVETTGANYGITANNGVSITDGTVTAKATNSTSDTGSAIYSGGGNGISIIGGTVMATGTSSSGKAYGLFLGGSGTIKIGSGITSLTLTGTTNASHGTVENNVAGMGWNTTDGTGDGTEIAVNTSGASLDTYKKLVFPYTKSEASVTSVPTPVSGLIYTGSAQELVDAGEAENGTLYYAVTDTDTEPESSAYSIDIPSKTNAGTYYVWYKVKGDAGYADCDPKYVIVTIKTKEEAHTHTFKLVEAKEPTCTEDGNKEYYVCPECSRWFEDATGSKEITDRSSYSIKATGHKWDKVEITKEATYDEEGIRTYTCSVCGETKTESIKKKERPSSYDDSDDSSSDDSDSGSSSSSGSSSKRYTEAQAKVDQINNVSTYSIPENHQVESGVPASDIGGRWGNNANADTWIYTKSDGTLAKSEWMSLDYNGLRYWYYFNEDGNMRTNWFDYKNERFYLMPEKDGWRGRMATGWKNIENKWYYFETVPGSSQGRLYRSSVTPDGHTVGADGAWNGVGETPVGQK